jgi:type III secretion system (T3SS) SseB-like protein
MSTSAPDDQNIQTPGETVDGTVRTAEAAAAEAAARELLTELAGSVALLPQTPPVEGEEPPTEDAIALPVIEQDGTQYVPVFTSEEALRAAGADPSTALRLPVAQLAADLADENLWLAVNPVTPEGLAIPPEVVRALPGFVDPPGEAEAAADCPPSR